MKIKVCNALSVSNLLIIVLMLSFCSSPTEHKETQETPDENWESLFNGKNLDGWKVKITGHELNDNYKNTFIVEDGYLKASYDEYDDFDGKFGHIFYEKPFSHYRLRIEYRFVGKQVNGGAGWAYRNNGIMFHCQSPESMELDQNFPVSIEAQILGGSGKGERPTANVCTPGTHIEIHGELITDHCTSSTSETFHGDQWVTMEIEVHGDSLVKQKVNGEVVFEYEKPQLDPTDKDAKKIIEKQGNTILNSGYIALQAESHPTEFRKIEVLVLED